MNKLDRISAILVMLQSRRIVTAQKIAEQFNVSLRTVYRDMRVIESSGVPVTGNAGYGYSLIDGYKLPPLMFTTEEAISFLMAEKLVSRQTDKDSYNLYRSGMDKIRAVLKLAEKDMLEHFDEYIYVLGDHGANQPQSSNVLQPLLHNILEQKAVEIIYHANYNQEVSRRTIEPLGIFFMSEAWYAMAYCLLRKDYRIFKINRIKEIIPLQNEFTTQHKELKELVKTIYHNDENVEIILRTNKSALRTIASSKYVQGLYKEIDKGEYIEQYYNTYSLEYFGRWYLSFADQSAIVEPPELKQLVKNILSDITI